MQNERTIFHFSDETIKKLLDPDRPELVDIIVRPTFKEFKRQYVEAKYSPPNSKSIDSHAAFKLYYLGDLVALVYVGREFINYQSSRI